MSTETPNLYAWWTPDGWTQSDAPEAYSVADQAKTGFDQSLEANGYRMLHKIGDSGQFITDVDIEVREHTDRHLYVGMGDCNGMLDEFFVAPQHHTPFMVDRFPGLIRDLASHEAASEWRTIRRAIVAFIRHGEGTDTIDEYGEYTFDDAKRAAADRRRIAERKAAEERAAKAAKP
jgi:hypothetical protein